MALAERQGMTDLSRIPGPEAGSHDDVFLTDLNAGWAELANQALGLGFRLDWDSAVSMGHLVAAVRRCPHHAAAWCLRARHEAVDLRRQSPGP